MNACNNSNNSSELCNYTSTAENVSSLTDSSSDEMEPEVSEQRPFITSLVSVEQVDDTLFRMAVDTRHVSEELPLRLCIVSTESLDAGFDAVVEDSGHAVMLESASEL